MDDGQNQREHNGADQACGENGATDQRIQNDFAPIAPFRLNMIFES